MGAIIAVGKLNVVFVDDDPKEIEQSVGFSPNIFTPKEWTTLKEFANKRHIHQRELNVVFKRFLMHDEVYLRKFHVRMIDVKAYFLDKSRLMQEICDVLVPMIYFKEYKGLESIAITPGTQVEDVSFARFLIMSYIFGAQPIPDLIFDFIATLRHKLNLKLNAAMFMYNFEEIVKVLVEEITPCMTLDVFMQHCNPQNDLEVDVHKLMLLCLKYPLAFYSLVRFRTHFRRLVYGDIFWSDKKALKSRFYSKFHLDGDYSKAFTSEAAARRETARALLLDCYYQQNTNEKLLLNEHVPLDPLCSINEELYLKAKQILGYRFARGLIIEAELPLDRSFPLFQQTGLGIYTDQFKTEEDIIEIESHTQDKPETTTPGDIYDVKTDRIHDKVSGQDFIYSVETGVREWVRHIESHSGDVLREITSQYPQGAIVNHYLERNDMPVTKLSPKKQK